MFSWLTYRVLAYVAGGLALLAVGLAFALWAQGVRVGHLENERDKALNDLAVAMGAIKGYQNAVKQCNEATAKLKTVSDEKAAAADQALARAQQEARRYQEASKRRAALLRAPTPPGAGCR